MKKNTVQAVVLAAGKSTRFKTGSTKLLEKLCGQEIILYPLNILNQLKIANSIVIGYKGQAIQNTIRKNFKNNEFIEQKEQLGTGHALLQTMQLWNLDNILVLNGDTPLINKDLINDLIEKHIDTQAAITFVTAHHTDPVTHYGRVIKTEKSIEIIESKDFTKKTEDSCCINGGIYIFKKDFLLKNIVKLSNSNVSSEYYITDLIKIASKQKLKVETIKAPFDHIRGINTLKELWMAEQVKRCEIISYWMEQGVRFSFAQSTHVDVNALIGSGTFIGSGVHILNNTKIGSNCAIEPFSILDNVQVADNTIIRSHSVISDSIIEANCTVGPFAHLHDKTYIQKGSIIGNFVETTRCTLGQHSKAKHLTYLGDTAIGKNVNIGAGTIVCNYDGKEKHNTTIEDNAFIGSNNTLISPVTIGQSAITGAGSVVTDNVPANSLAIGRARQINKHDYANKIQKDRRKKNNPELSFIGATKTQNDIVSSKE
ncbi:MAG: bifunctional UDP-N-acetylglucosamine diphosphorylase/glucosamine-1-phosphate N-acetyltransferase GlmU [Candidatus Babeliales bacterium]